MLNPLLFISIINLIPYNESSNISFKRSKKDTILRFYDIIKKEDLAK